MSLADFRELMEGYLPMVGPIGGYFWQTRQELLEGEELLLELEVRNPNKLFALECVSLGSLRRLGMESLPGYVLAFKPQEESVLKEMLNTVSWNLIGANRRLHPRYRAALPVAWAEETSDQVHVGHTENICLGGAFVRCPVLPAVDSLITVHLRHESMPSPLTLLARVAWTKQDMDQPGMGIQFLQADPRTLRRLRTLIHEAAQTV